MKLIKSEDANINYCAHIIKIDTFEEHPTADRLKIANVMGYKISISKDSPEGMYVYVPLESKINETFLYKNNMFRDPTTNSDTTKKGFFESNCRVKCIRLQGLLSEGILFPVKALEYMGSVENITEGTVFNKIDDTVFCEKYIILDRSKSKGMQNHPAGKSFSGNILEGQFRFHKDTPKFKDNINRFTLDTEIEVTYKYHGTSAIFCNLLVKNKLSIWDKIKKYIFFQDVPKYVYQDFCSSRSVIKNPYLVNKKTVSYYDMDLWNLVHSYMKEFLMPGISFYGEIIGYMPTGKMIQKNYDYGCIYDPKKFDYSKMTAKEMIAANLFKVKIYRITDTSEDGSVVELNYDDIETWCTTDGLECVDIFYKGTVRNLLEKHTIKIPEEVSKEFLMSSLSSIYLEGLDPKCANKVPFEGVVIRIPGESIETYKLKSLRFLKKESDDLDKEIIDIESNN